MTTDDYDDAIEKLKRKLISVLLSGDRFTLFDNQYLRVEANQEIKMSDDEREDPDKVSMARETGVFMIAAVHTSLSEEPSHYTPIRIGGTDEFLDMVTERLKREEKTASEIRDTLAHLTLETFQIPTSRELRKMTP